MFTLLTFWRSSCMIARIINYAPAVTRFWKRDSSIYMLLQLSNLDIMIAHFIHLFLFIIPCSHRWFRESVIGNAAIFVFALSNWTASSRFHRSGNIHYQRNSHAMTAFPLSSSSKDNSRWNFCISRPKIIGNYISRKKSRQDISKVVKTVFVNRWSGLIASRM